MKSASGALLVSDIFVVGDDGETVGVIVVGGPGGVDAIVNPGVTMGTVGGGVTVEVVGSVCERKERERRTCETADICMYIACSLYVACCM